MISILTLRPSYFRPPHNKQDNSDPFTEMKPITISNTDIKSISTNQTKTKSISMPIQVQAIFDPDTTTKPIPITSLKSNQFRSPILTSSRFGSPTPKPSQLQPNQVIFGTYEKLSPFRPPTPKPSESILTRQTSYLPPARKNKVDPHAKNKSSSIHILHPSHSRGAHRKKSTSTARV